MAKHNLRKKRVAVTQKQIKQIKIRITQGFTSNKIAEILSLPVGVVKRYFNSNYFDIKNRTSCMNCGKKINKGNITCNICKKKASAIDDSAMFIATENRPSEIPDIDISKEKKDRI